jgi:Fur family peroxide stress response transcriptional regulator
MVSQETLEQRMDRFKQGLRATGIKLTHQRIEIFLEVAGAEDHPDAETIFEGVRRRIPTMSLDTVYRTLWMLIDLGLLTTLGPARDRMRFDANTGAHHHFVCTKCGMTRDFDSEEIDSLQLPDMVISMGTVEIKQMEVRGVCSKCSKATSNEKRARRKKEEL